VPREAPPQARKLTFGANTFRAGLRWLSNGKLVTTAETSGTVDISVRNEDGSNPKQLLGELTGRASAILPAVAPDGRALTYTDPRQTNLWLQLISGGEPQKLTDFTNDLIFGYEWSPDGKRLICVRGLWERNLVLIKNIR
jgi:Tol biopolymer transport system component